MLVKALDGSLEARLFSAMYYEGAWQSGRVSLAFILGGLLGRNGRSTARTRTVKDGRDMFWLKLSSWLRHRNYKKVIRKK
jgi:hypothetical protein